MNFSQDHQFDLSTFLKSLTHHCGVYRMIDKHNKIIYVGKAKNLYNRVNSYFKKGAKDTKTISMVQKIMKIEITITSNDYDALLLENRLIKTHQPKYNILFKDDKSYPYIALSNHKHPRIYSFRGKKNAQPNVFGPYASISSVKDTLILLQNIFKLRQCTDSYYQNRKRPCLQYQINNCLGPCVAKVSDSVYQEQVDLFKKFMLGKVTEVLNHLTLKMEKASENQQYEQALRYRDQLITMRRLQAQQMMGKQLSDTFDVIGIAQKNNQVCFVLMQVRQGDVLLDKHWFDQLPMDLSQALEMFLCHIYLDERHDIPASIILPRNAKLDSIDITLKSLITYSGHNIQWLIRPADKKLQWQKLAYTNAFQKLEMSENEKSYYQKKWDALTVWLDVVRLNKIECFDISHFNGEATVASCVVYDKEGPQKRLYRRYNINNITPGDDYAALDQALTRRLNKDINETALPDLFIIDGGLGQIKRCYSILKKFKLSDTIKMISLSKGAKRISGDESIFIADDFQPVRLDKSELHFLLMRQIRDSAHDYAIINQRKSVNKNRQKSIIDSIPNIGVKRKKYLLLHFGGWQGIMQASVNDLSKVNGISKKLAENIWHYLH